MRLASWADLAVGLGAAACLAVTPLAWSQSPGDIGSWAVGVPMNVPRVGTGTAEVGGKLYQVTGMSDWDVAVPQVEVFDPTSRTWTIRGPMIRPRWGAGVTALDGRIYVVGGYYGGGSYSRDVEVYFPETDSWRVLPPLPSPRVGIRAVALNGRIYAFGTTDEASPIYEYDPVGGAWATRSPMGAIRYRPTGAAFGGRLYAFGGFDRQRGSLSSAERYDPATDRWTPIAPMSRPRVGAQAVVFRDRIYVIGGSESVASQSSTSLVEEYDPLLDRWRTVAPLLTPRNDPGAAVLGDKVIVTGGFDSQTMTFLSSVEEFTPPVPAPCEPGSAVLSAGITAKAGTQEARRWTVTVSNASRCPADQARIEAITLVQTAGIACTPVVAPPPLPIQLGAIAPAASAKGDVVVNFSACAATARFTARIRYSADDGAIRGVRAVRNQFR